MKLEISPDWRLMTDPNNVILERRIPGGKVITVGKHKGQLSKDSWKPSFHANIEQALCHLVDQNVRDLDDIRELDAKLKEIKGWIRGLGLARSDRTESRGGYEMKG